MSLLTQSPTPNGIKLAVNIISTDFGNLVAKVCECLLRRGCLLKGQISRFTELSQDKVIKCLWVLIQHNCVQAFALEQEGGGETTTVVTQYMALFNNIICRLRFAKFLMVVSKEVDKEAFEILRGLLHHGRLTLPQILDRAMETSDQGEDASRDICNKSFMKLLRGRFVERCPAAEPFIPLPTDEENSKQSRPKARKFAKKEVTLEESVLAASIPMDGERFSILNEYDDVDSDADKKEGNIPSAKVGDKRKQDFLRGGDSELLGVKQEPIWRVNCEEFINCLRKKACVEYIRASYDNTAAVTLQSMLKGTKSTEYTASLSLDSIFEEVLKSEEGPGMNLELVRCSLEQLHFCSEEDGVYSINMKDIIEKAQLEEVESLVLKRYGDEAFRIFRSLSTGRAMHTDQISEKTLTDKKNTPKILYGLWKDNFLEMEKIATGGGQKQTDLIFWSVKMDKIWRKVLDELHHTALNLSLRSAYEVEKHRQVTSIAKKAGAGKARSEELDKKFRHAQGIYVALLKSVMEIDDAIMLFSDFAV